MSRKKYLKFCVKNFLMQWASYCKSKKSCITSLWSFECNLKPAHEFSLSAGDKIGTVIKRKYSATCLVKYYNNFFDRLVFCTENVTSL